jgi:hypothetical protein
MTMAKKKHLFSPSGFATARVVSAVIANAAKQDIVVTCTSLKPFASAVYGDFSVVGTAKTIDSIALNQTAKTLTVHVTVAYANGNTCTLVYNSSKAKLPNMSIAITNNVA